MRKIYLVVLACLAVLAVSPDDSEAKRRLGAHYTVTATAYSPCDGAVGVGTMAYGRQVYTGAVASNIFPAKTLVKLDRPIRTTDMLGRSKLRRWFRVEDTGATFDIWMANCQEMYNWGVRTIGLRVAVR